MLTNRMISNQTGPEGVPVSILLVAPAVDIAKEYYSASPSTAPAARPR